MPKIWISSTESIEFAKVSGDLFSSHFATREKTLNFTGGIGNFLPDPDPILRRAGKDIKAYRDILCDGHLGSVVDSRKAGVLTLEWRIQRKNASENQTKLIEDLFNCLDMNQIITEILDAALFGYKPLEILWPGKKINGAILPLDLVGKPPEWFRFSNDNKLLFITRDNYNGIEVPENKFVLAQNDASYDNPYGKRVLSRCFWPVTFKRGGMKFWAMFIEKYGMPWVIGKHPRNMDEDQVEDLLDMLDNLFQNAVGTIPEDSSVEIIEAAGKSASSDVYQTFENYLDKEMSKAVLGQTLTTEMQSIGSFAASQTHLQVRKEIVDGDKKIVQNVFNRLIQLIFELNFGKPESAPSFELFEEEDVDKALAERDEILTKTGVKFSKQYYVKTYGLDEDDFEISETAPRDDAPSEFESLQSRHTGFFPQDKLDEFADQINNDAVSLQSQAESILDVIFDLANKSGSYEDFSRKLADVYPEIDSEPLRKSVEQAMFTGRIWGRVNAEE